MQKFKEKFGQGIDHLEGTFKGWEIENPTLILSKKKKNPDLIVPDTHLHDVKAEATHLKAKVGKFFNIINPNHRHDEEHEQATDRKRSEIADSHRFKSFAPIHDGNRVKWYVDGKDYMWAVSEALEKATETIYIADWWLSPELFLRRPPVEHQEWRLDQVLKRRAEAGVKIYIIVYKEVGIFLLLSREEPN